MSLYKRKKTPENKDKNLQSNTKMKTVFTIREAAENVGIANAHQLHLETGLSIARSRKAWDGELKPESIDFDLICDGIGCEITDLIKRIPINQKDTFVNIQNYLQILVLARGEGISDAIRLKLAGNQIETITSFDTLSTFLTNPSKVDCVVVYIIDNQDWIMLNLLKTTFPKTPIYIVFSELNDTEENREQAKSVGVDLTFSLKKLKVLSSTIQTSVVPSNKKRIPIQQTLSSILNELKRLDSEFFETAARTLPQPKVPKDTDQRLRYALFNLQGIQITP